MAKLRREHVMIAREMIARDASIRDVAGKLDVDESTLRYGLKRPVDAPDGRRDQGTALDGWEDVVNGVLHRFGDGRVFAGSTTRCSARTVCDVLVREFGFREATSRCAGTSTGPTAPRRPPCCGPRR